MDLLARADEGFCDSDLRVEAMIRVCFNRVVTASCVWQDSGRFLGNHEFIARQRKNSLGQHDMLILCILDLEIHMDY